MVNNFMNMIRNKVLESIKKLDDEYLSRIYLCNLETFELEIDCKDSELYEYGLYKLFVSIEVSPRYVNIYFKNNNLPFNFHSMDLYGNESLLNFKSIDIYSFPIVLHIVEFKKDNYLKYDEIDIYALLSPHVIYEINDNKEYLIKTVNSMHFGIVNNSVLLEETMDSMLKSNIKIDANKGDCFEIYFQKLNSNYDINYANIVLIILSYLDKICISTKVNIIFTEYSLELFDEESFLNSEIDWKRYNITIVCPLTSVDYLNNHNIDLFKSRFSGKLEIKNL